MRVSQHERSYRVRVRSNITRALTALDLNTVNDIQQTSAALAQCTVSRMRARGSCEERKEGMKIKKQTKKGQLVKTKNKVRKNETVKKANK